MTDLVGDDWGEKVDADVGGRPKRDGWRVRLCVGVPMCVNGCFILKALKLKLRPVELKRQGTYHSPLTS
jgi:hypothetical protein